MSFSHKSLRTVGLLPAHLVNLTVELVKINYVIEHLCCFQLSGGPWRKREEGRVSGLSRAMLGQILRHWASGATCPHLGKRPLPRADPLGRFLKVKLSRK